ncbi:MAG: hypothetical protein ACOC8E_03230 [Planctomycetota bacterium]
MRTWIVVAAVLVAGLIGFALPTRSQDQTRVGAVVDVTALAKKIDRIPEEIETLQKQARELKEAVEESNRTLAVIAAGVGVMREPIRWEYKFVRSRSEKLANEQGAKGWELVDIFKEEWFIFRRPLPPRKLEEPEE